VGWTVGQMAMPLALGPGRLRCLTAQSFLSCSMHAAKVLRLPSSCVPALVVHQRDFASVVVASEL
jgi:hypothetical protein